MARATWAPFECSSLAAKLQDGNEQERLFVYGYQQGLSFISALRAQKIQPQDLNREVPLIMGLLLEGPTPDFMLGRVYEAAQEAALENVYKSGETFNPEDVQRTIAQHEFMKRNCRLIGDRK